MLARFINLNTITLLAHKYFKRLTTRYTGFDMTDRFLNEKFYKIRKYYFGEILDLGCGKGNFTRFLTSNNLNVTACDVNITDESCDLKPVLYDGKKLPFSSQSFDVSLLMFVLHHAKNKKLVLSEASRVTSSYIIIAEDLVENTLDRFMGSIHLKSTKWGKGGSRDGFLSNKQWKDTFIELGLTVLSEVEISRFKKLCYPIKRKIYVLKTNQRD